MSAVHTGDGGAIEQLRRQVTAVEQWLDNPAGVALPRTLGRPEDLGALTPADRDAAEALVGRLTRCTERLHVAQHEIADELDAFTQRRVAARRYLDHDAPTG